MLVQDFEWAGISFLYGNYTGIQWLDHTFNFIGNHHTFPEWLLFYILTVDEMQLFQSLWYMACSVFLIPAILMGV